MSRLSRMEQARFLAGYTWSSDEFPVCTVNVPAKELSLRLHLPLVRWDEHGLGESCGFGCRLPSSLVLKVVELEQLAGESTIYIETHEVVERGVSAAIGEVLAGLGLSSESITGNQTEESLERARQIALTTKTAKLSFKLTPDGAA